MKAIVFGGSGFLGSHVADALTAAGYTVRLFDTRPSTWKSPEQELMVGDITDAAAVHAAVAGCDVVYNFAGYADIGEAHAAPAAALQTNIAGTINILEACVAQRVRRFVFASTLYVYSDKGSFYRCSKQCCELIIESYRQAFGLPYTILRYGSLYGPRSGGKNWIHALVRQALTEKKITRAGDGEELREYLHIADAARASVAILTEEYADQFIIISGHERIRIRHLMEMVGEMLGNTVNIEFTPEKTFAEHYELTPYVFKPQTARKLTVNPHIDLGQGLLEMLHEAEAELRDGGAEQERKS